MPSFTIQNTNLETVGPQSEIMIGISSPYAEFLKIQGQTIPNPIRLMSIIDTGATSTVIQEGIAQKLGLKPKGVTSISTATVQGHQCYIYDVSIIFPNGVYYPLIPVIEAPLGNPPIHCLIGRDVLKSGIFVYIGYANIFSLSF